MAVIAVLTNLPDSESAFNLARELVQLRLAACANVLARGDLVLPMGRPRRAGHRGTRCSSSPRASATPSSRRRSAQRHPYSLPEIIAWPIETGLAEVPRLGRGRVRVREPHAGRDAIKWIFASGRALLALMAGAALWLGTQDAPAQPRRWSRSAPATLYAATFHDRQGAPQSLGRFQGKVVVLNFWATWCAPCREEMPAFARLQSRWAAQGRAIRRHRQRRAQRVEPFGKDLGIELPPAGWAATKSASCRARLGNRVRSASSHRPDRPVRERP